MLQASPLKTIRSASAESEIVAAEAKSEEKAVSPEKSTAFRLVDGRLREGDREAADGEPRDDREHEVPFLHDAQDEAASSITAKMATAAATASTTVQPKSPQPGPP